MPRIAIIGAGVSGLTTAFDLAGADCEVSVFEKSRGLSGRAASRTKNGCRYDHGANYFTLNCNEIAKLVFDSLPMDQLCRIVGEIRPFTGDGVVSPGDPSRDKGAKWSYRGGISTLGKLLVESADLEVTREFHLESISRDAKRWNLYDLTGDRRGPFDAVVMTPPAPQTISLLETISTDSEILADLVMEMEKAQFQSQFSIILNYPGDVVFPGGAYALLNSDGQHPIAWLSRENHKADHIPNGETLLIAQLSQTWTESHYDDPRDDVIDATDAAVRELLGNQLPRLSWADSQRWRYARPGSHADLAKMQSGERIGLFFAGDAFAERCRISGAMMTGIAASKRIRAHFDLG